MTTEEHFRLCYGASMSAEQLADLYGVSPKTLANWKSSGQIAIPQVGRSHAARYDVRDVAAVWDAARGASVDALLRIQKSLKKK